MDVSRPGSVYGRVSLNIVEMERFGTSTLRQAQHGASSVQAQCCASSVRCKLSVEDVEVLDLRRHSWGREELRRMILSFDAIKGTFFEVGLVDFRL